MERWKDADLSENCDRQVGGTAADLQIELPQIAVVGSQSSGKSSVLESLVGRDFLPRGPDICTRRPLVLQLVNVPAAQGSPTEWGEFLHLPGQKFYEFSSICDEIQAETDREVGNNKGISEKQIRLKIYSPNVLTMTLVDLPGITKVPVGDQPDNIEQMVKDMIHSYIKCPTCIILAVSPANSDLANSDALHFARSVDPDGYRTIGVITKLDIMDKGTDAKKYLTGEVYPLRLGYIGVVNRSQDDINQSKTVRDALLKEEQFFSTNSMYNDISQICGTPRLSMVLHHILGQHIKASIPELRAHLSKQAEKLAKELMALGEAQPDTKAGQGAMLLQILTQFSEGIQASLDGRSTDLPDSELSGGARIHHIFQDIFVPTLDMVDPTDQLTDEAVRTVVQNSSGVKGSLLIPEAPFELLVRQQIARLKEPCLQCSRFVHEELISLCRACVPPTAGRFPTLEKRLLNATDAFLADGAIPSQKMISDQVACELAYINTQHPQFLAGTSALKTVLRHHQDRMGFVPENLPNPRYASDEDNYDYVQAAKHVEEIAHGQDGSSEGTPPKSPTGWMSAAKEALGMTSNTSKRKAVSLPEPPQTLRVTGPKSERERVEVEITRSLVTSYFNIVKHNLQDFTPKSIMNFLVNRVQSGLQQFLIRTLYREELFDEIMKEREDMAQRRQRCKMGLKVVKEALKVLDQVPSEVVARVPPMNGGGGASAKVRAVVEPGIETTIGSPLPVRR